MTPPFSKGTVRAAALVEVVGGTECRGQGLFEGTHTSAALILPKKTTFNHTRPRGEITLTLGHEDSSLHCLCNCEREGPRGAREGWGGVGGGMIIAEASTVLHQIGKKFTNTNKQARRKNTLYCRTLLAVASMLTCLQNHTYIYAFFF